MGFPVLEEITAYSGNTASTTHNVTLPLNPSPGDFLVMYLGNSSATLDNVTAPAGWTHADYVEAANLGATVQEDVLVRKADGSESATVAVSVTSAIPVYGLTLRFRRNTWFDSGVLSEAYGFGTAFVETASTTTPDPPSLAPPWGGGLPAVAIASAVWGSTTDPTGYPSGYGNSEVAPHTFSPGVAVATKEVRTTEDPGVFTLPSGVSVAIAQTMMIRGSSAGGGLFFGPGF